MIINNFKLIDQNEYKLEEIEMGFSFNSYGFDFFKSEEELLMDFFTNNNFKREDFNKIIRDDITLKCNYLKVPFNFTQITFNDWLKIKYKDVLKFIWENFSPYVESDRNIESEKILFERIIQIIESSKSENYFILSVDFFDKSYDSELNMKSSKLSCYDSTIYTFYFLICWIENDEIRIGEFLHD